MLVAVDTLANCRSSLTLTSMGDSSTQTISQAQLLQVENRACAGEHRNGLGFAILFSDSAPLTSDAVIALHCNAASQDDDNGDRCFEAAGAPRSTITVLGQTLIVCETFDQAAHVAHLLAKRAGTRSVGIVLATFAPTSSCQRMSDSHVRLIRSYNDLIGCDIVVTTAELLLSNEYSKTVSEIAKSLQVSHASTAADMMKLQGMRRAFAQHRGRRTSALACLYGQDMILTNLVDQDPEAETLYREDDTDLRAVATPVLELIVWKRIWMYDTTTYQTVENVLDRFEYQFAWWIHGKAVHGGCA
jgi:hypothetical protein